MNSCSEAERCPGGKGTAPSCMKATNEIAILVKASNNFGMLG
jgi:hypothetical protein